MFQFNEDNCINISLLVLIMIIVILILRFFFKNENFAGTIPRRKILTNKKVKPNPKPKAKPKPKPKAKPKPKPKPKPKAKPVYNSSSSSFTSTSDSLSNQDTSNFPNGALSYGMGLGQILDSVGEIVISKDKVKIGKWTLKKD